MINKIKFFENHLNKTLITIITTTWFFIISWTTKPNIFKRSITLIRIRRRIRRIGDRRIPISVHMINFCKNSVLSYPFPT